LRETISAHEATIADLRARLDQAAIERRRLLALADRTAGAVVAKVAQMSSAAGGGA
jgi:hypothetical protein